MIKNRRGKQVSHRHLPVAELIPVTPRLSSVPSGIEKLKIQRVRTPSPHLLRLPYYSRKNAESFKKSEKTSLLKWSERIPGAYSASPVYADGRIYLFSEQGQTVVIKPGVLPPHEETSLPHRRRGFGSSS